MRKVILLLTIVFNFAFAKNPEDLPDFTAPLLIRSAMVGDFLAPDTSKPNWNLRQVTLTEQMRRGDPFDKFNLGAVQFVNVKDSKMCLGIDESGFFALKSCKDDLKSGKFETLFTIMPTTSGAVQIRSFVGNKDECISIFFNPTLPRGYDFGINPCSVDSYFDVRFTSIMLLVPPLIEAKTINP